jgi:hypothetical protein
MKRMTVVFALLFVAVSLRAQTPPAAAAAPNAKVKKLLQLTGAGALGMQMIDQMMGSFKESMPDVPEEFWTGVRAKFKPDDLVDLVAPIYAKHLTDSDVDELITFFSSPAGKHFVEKQPLILADSMKVGQEWGERIAADVISDLQKKGYGPKK